MRALVVSVVSLVALMAASLSHRVQAQEWPQHPVKIVIPYGPGGNADIVARVLAQHLSEQFGKPFVAENRPGAAGVIAADAVARAAPDGYTLFLATLPQIATVPVLNKTAYDPVKSFSPISVVGTNSYVFATHPSLPVKTIGDFVRHAKSQPGKVNYGAAGAGGLSHLLTALFAHRAGLQLNAVMYKAGGTAPMTDLIAGHIPVYFTSMSEVAPNAKSGAIRALAITSETRNPQLPDVPTFIESGFPDFKIVNWVGLMAPAGTPKPIVDWLSQAVARAVRDKLVAQRLGASGVDPVSNTPEQFTAQIAADIKLWSEAIKAAGLKTP